MAATLVTALFVDDGNAERGWQAGMTRGRDPGDINVADETRRRLRRLLSASSPATRCSRHRNHAAAIRQCEGAGWGRQRLFAASRCSRSAACLYRAVDATRERPLSPGGDFAA